MQKKEILKTATPKPVDMLVATNEIFIELLNEFLEDAEHKRKIFVSPQLNSSSNYMPRLHTETNGALDWSGR